MNVNFSKAESYCTNSLAALAPEESTLVKSCKEVAAATAGPSDTLLTDAPAFV